MKYIPATLWVLAGLGTVVSVGAVFVESSMAARAKPTQRVRVTATDELFGGPGYEPIGTPQDMIFDAPPAVLDKKGPNGEVLVDEEKLIKLKVYPLQLQTVRFTANIAKASGAGLAVLGGLLAYLAGRRLKKSPQESPETSP